MSGEPGARPQGSVRAAAARLAGVDRLPTALRAVMGHYAEAGVFDPMALRIKSRVDDRMAEIRAEALDGVEAALAEAFDRDDVEFKYETKLLLPVELTLGYVYGRAVAAAPPGVDPIAGTRSTRAVDGLRRRLADPAADAEAVVAEVERADAVARLAVEALLDGDMRDAINDEEYGDFIVDFPAEDEATQRRVAEVAQAALRERVEERFQAFGPEVREAYDRALAVSERHQDRDPHFRALLAAVAADDDGPVGNAFDAVGDGSDRGAEGGPSTDSEGDGGAEGDGDDPVERLRREYRDASVESSTAPFDDAERRLPYLGTQYSRVGVIYEGMIGMFQAAGVDVEPAFERAVVLAIVGAQLWLDDVDDFWADAREGQLTPVTAEYLLAPDERTAYENVVGIVDRYLDRARTAAVDSDSAMTGIGVEYIYRAGDPSVLPGSDG